MIRHGSLTVTCCKGLLLSQQWAFDLWVKAFQSLPTAEMRKTPYLKMPKNSWLSMYQNKSCSGCRFREGQITQDMWEYNRPGVPNPWAAKRYRSVACYEPGHESRGGMSERSFICACTESRLWNPSPSSPVLVPSVRKVGHHCNRLNCIGYRKYTVGCSPRLGSKFYEMVGCKI